MSLPANVDYAAMKDRVREVASPLKTLHPGVAPSTPETGTAAKASATDEVTAARTGTSRNAREPVGMEPTMGVARTAGPAGSQAPSAAASASSAAAASGVAIPGQASAAAAAGRPDADPPIIAPPSASTTASTTASATASPSSAPAATMGTADSLPQASAPVHVDPATQAIPAESAECRAELQALGLCSKVVR